MTTSTGQVGYTKWAGSDDFDPVELAENWDKADAQPGIHRCTSGTRPTWTSAQDGRLIFETDTDLHWRYLDPAWVRVYPVGLLDDGVRTSNLVTTGSYQTVCQAAVTIPDGGRSVAVSVSWGDPTALIHFALYADAVLVAEWHAAASCSGGKTIVDTPAAGGVTYALKAKNDGSAATLTGSATTISTISVVEV